MTGTGSIFVTGGAGYIGSHTVLTLLDRGLTPVVLDNLSTGRRDLVPEGVPFVEGNAGDVDLVREVLREYGCGSVIHFAGSILAVQGRCFRYELDKAQLV